MKKLSLLLAALLLALPLASCTGGASDATTASTPTNDPAVTTPATTTKNPILDKVTTKAPETDEPVTDPSVEVPVEAFSVGTAAELVAAIDAINSGSASEDADITLTADIDMSGLAGVGAYEPLYRYSGTFDGAGHTIRNLNWIFVMANGGGNMPNADQPGSYVLENLPDGTAGRYAKGTVALLVLQLNEKGSVKDLTLADSSLTIQCSYNKNYQMYIGGAVGYVNGGALEGVELSNVDVTVPANVNYNQGFPGYAAPLAARVAGNVALANCSADADCTVDTSANVMFNIGTLVGVAQEGDTVNTEGSASQAVCTVHTAPTKDVLAYKGEGITLGGNLGGLIGFTE